LSNFTTTYLNEADVYNGFSSLTKKSLLNWKSRVVRYDDYPTLSAAFDRMNQSLQSSNAIVFFDHHYAFDAIPLGLALAQHIQYASGIIIPFSVHLEMGVGRDGGPSVRYFFRTMAFKWFVGGIAKSNPSIQFFPVVRDFEKDTPRLNKIVDERFSGVNTVYLKTFLREFAENPSGKVCFLTPFSGIGFPDKPLLHKQLYRSVDLVQAKCGRRIPIFILGAYPSWEAYAHYYAPLMTEHNIVMRGPFELPQKDYQAAFDIMQSEMMTLRQAGNFVPPEYDRILKK